MTGAKMKRREDGELICMYCGKELMTPRGFLPCPCVNMQWQDVAPPEQGVAAKPKKIDGQKEAATYVSRFLKDYPCNRGLYLYGPAGVGKTYLAEQIVAEVSRRGDNVAMYYMPDLVHACKASIGKPEDSPLLDCYEAADMCKLMVLDDLLSERASGYTAEIILGLVNRRYRSEMPMIITSNFSPEDMAEMVDQRTYSRIMGMCHAVRVGGTDLRGRKPFNQIGAAI